MFALGHNLADIGADQRSTWHQGYLGRKGKISTSGLSSNTIGAKLSLWDDWVVLATTLTISNGTTRL